MLRFDFIEALHYLALHRLHCHSACQALNSRGDTCALALMTALSAVSGTCLGIASLYLAR